MTLVRISWAAPLDGRIRGTPMLDMSGTEQLPCVDREFRLSQDAPPIKPWKETSHARYTDLRPLCRDPL
jgi:hypothetical protein